MRLSALALAIVAVSGPTIANPVDVRGANHPWSIANFSFCRGEHHYKYSFNVKGEADGNTPAFYGTCIGTNGKVFLECTASPSEDAFNLFAKTKIVDGAPKVTIRTWYVDNGCRYTRQGSMIDSDATCASRQGSRFKIVPEDSAECN